jgi:predicted nucleic acid-binding protein
VSSGFLLDTNIPSELIRARPEPRVENWVSAKDEPISLSERRFYCELRQGFVILPARKRRNELEQWFENDLLPRFRGRILSVTHSIADCWAILELAAGVFMRWSRRTKPSNRNF